MPKPRKWATTFGLAIELQSVGLDEQITKLERFDAIARPITRQASREGITYIVGGWRGIVPVFSGQYVGSIVGDVKIVHGLQTLAVASTDALGADRYPYPFMLESSRKRFPRTVGKVKLVLSRARSAVEADFRQALERVAKALEVHR